MAKPPVVACLAVALVFVVAAPARSQQTLPAANTSQATTIDTPGAQIESAERAVSDSGSMPSIETQESSDTRPPSGAQSSAIGPEMGQQTSWIPAVTLTTQLQRNPPGLGYPTWTTVGYALGSLGLHLASGRSQMLVNYTGGGMIASFGGLASSDIQELNFSEQYSWERLSLTLADQVSYLAQSPFGFGGVGGLGFVGSAAQTNTGAVAGATLPSLQPTLTPNQTIPTVYGYQLSDATIVQTQYRLSPRSSWTATGSYDVLHFFTSGYVNSNSFIIQTGYNYQLSRQSTIAVLVRFDAFRFNNSVPGLNDQVLQLSYSQRAGNRWSWQLAAGPDVQMYQASTSSSGPSYSWTLDGALNYQFSPNTTLAGRYDHFVTAGSGVLAGAQTDQAQGVIGRNLPGRWQVGVSAGYAANRVLPGAPLSSAAGSLDSWFGTIRLSHVWQPGVAFFISYGAQLQGENKAGCSPGSCGATLPGQNLSVGFSWTRRPL